MMRIIAGTHRGRRLKAPKGSATRPTLDRVREAAFSILGPMHGLHVIDCYAGTGALGMEAASRGARSVLLVEFERHAQQVMAENLRDLGLDARCSIFYGKVERLAPVLQQRDPLDLVLADPPWPIALQAANVVAEIVGPYLKPDARVVLGHPARLSLQLDVASPLVLEDERRWGDSAMSFFRAS